MKRDSGNGRTGNTQPDDAKGSANERSAKSSSRSAASAQEAFVSYAAPFIDKATGFARALHDDPSPEALHKLRVALRHLRSLWWAYRPLLEKAENTRQQALFRYLASAAGKTRDWDILIALLTSKKSGAEALAPTLRQVHDDTFAVSSETLANADVKHLLRDSLAGAAKELNTAHERMPLRKFATRRVDAAEHSLKKRMKRARRAKRSNYAAFHDVRKAAKKLRYLLDFFQGDLKGSHKRMVKRLKLIQKRFGALNDVVASEGLLRDHSASLAGADPVAALNWLEKERKHRLRAAAGLLD